MVSLRSACATKKKKHFKTRHAKSETAYCPTVKRNAHTHTHIDMHAHIRTTTTTINEKRGYEAEKARIGIWDSLEGGKGRGP